MRHPLLLAAAAAVLLAPGAAGRDLWVGRRIGGMDRADTYRRGPLLATLAEALAVARAGDTVHVLDGEHDADVVVDVPVTILGTHNWRRPRLRGLMRVRADGVVLDRLRFTGGSSVSLLVEGADDVRVTHCVFSDVDVAMQLVDARRATIERNQVLRAESGLRLVGGADHRVRRNGFDSCGWYAVQVEGAAGLRFVGNTITRPAWIGIVLHSGAGGALVEENTVEGGAVGIALATDGNVVRRNLLRGNARGVYLGRGTVGRLPAVSGELAWADAEDGGVFVDATRNLIEDNRIEGALREGVLAKHAPGNRIAGNIVAGSRHGVVLLSGADGNVVEGNTFERLSGPGRGGGASGPPGTDERPGAGAVASPAVTAAGTAPAAVVVVASRRNVVRGNSISDGLGVRLVDAPDTTVEGAAVVHHAPGEVPHVTLDAPDGSGRKAAFGDFHLHSTLSDGASLPEELVLYGRDVLGLDFMALSDHAEPMRRLAGHWERLNDVLGAAHAPGRFVAIPGYEVTYSLWWQGHYNVYFPHERGRLVGSPHDLHDLVPDLSAVTPFDLLEALKADGEDFLIIRHHFMGALDYWHEAPEDPFHLPATEVCSAHGVWTGHVEVDEKSQNRRGEGAVHVSTLRGALASGRVTAVVGSSDSHWSLPADHGLAGVLVDELTREAVFEAVRARRTWATTGARIALALSMDGSPMGSVLAPEAPPVITASVAGTAPLDVVELFEGDRVLRAVRPGGAADSDGTDDPAAGAGDGRAADRSRADLVVRLDRIPPPGTSYHLRVRQTDGHRAWSTPIWVRPPAPRMAGAAERRDKRAMTLLVLAQTLRVWVDLPLPMLSGATPRAALADASGRARVETTWPRIVAAARGIEALAAELGPYTAAELEAVIERYMPRWSTLPARMRPIPDFAIDTARTARKLGLGDG